MLMCTCRVLKSESYSLIATGKKALLCGPMSLLLRRLCWWILHDAEEHLHLRVRCSMCHMCLCISPLFCPLQCQRLLFEHAVCSSWCILVYLALAGQCAGNMSWPSLSWRWPRRISSRRSSSVKSWLQGYTVLMFYMYSFSLPVNTYTRLQSKHIWNPSHCRCVIYLSVN